LRKSFRSSNAVTAKQAGVIDHITINRHGIPGIILMERAGRAVAEEVLLVAKKRHNANARPKVAVFCGKGNNGGDGLVCARYLLSAGLDVQVHLLFSKNKLKGDAFYNIHALKKFNPLKKSFRADIIIDAVFGTGFYGRPDPACESVIKLINSNTAYTIAVDVPSGIDATTGIAQGAAVIADKTVTMGFAKTGFYKNNGLSHCGEIKVADIGLRR